jgi:hypothetical protein
MSSAPGDMIEPPERASIGSFAHIATNGGSPEGGKGYVAGCAPSLMLRNSGRASTIATAI